MDETRFTLSRHVDRLPLGDGRTVVAHGLLLRRGVFSAALLAQLDRFGKAALSRLEFTDGDPILDRAFSMLLEMRLLVAVDQDEDAALAGDLSRLSLAGDFPTRAAWEASATRSTESLEGRHGLGAGDGTRPVRVVILGGCLAQLAADALRVRALSSGLVADVVTGWPSDLHLVAEHDPELVLLQPGIGALLSGLWDDAPFLPDDQRQERLDAIAAQLRRTVTALLQLAVGRLLIVQGIASPTLLPDGRADFRSRLGLDRAASDLNRTLQDLVRNEPNALFLDEERLLSVDGKARLLDDLVLPAGHRGPLDFLDHHGEPLPRTMRELFGLAEPLRAVRLLANEVLDLYDLWRGAFRIKLVVTDLDDTLWPGVVGEGPTPSVPLLSLHAGIQQALSVLRARGVLLATASRNDEREVLERWPEIVAPIAHTRWALRPEDFVLHRISWGRKSDAVREIAERLGVALDAVLFLDDNPVERAEVKAALPRVRVLGEELHRVRERLLSDPCLQLNVRTVESGRRAEMTKAQLERDEARTSATDEAAFRRGLAIRVDVGRLAEDDPRLARVAELTQRTSQFHTSLRRYDAGTLAARIRGGATRVYAASVEDRFASYGLTAACVLDGPEVESVVMSCRVLSLDVGVPFLVSVLAQDVLRQDLLHQEKEDGLRATLRRVERNRPCWRLFGDSGFVDEGDGVFRLRSAADLSPIDPSVYDVRLTA